LTQVSHLEDLLELRKVKISFRDLMSSFHVPKDWILLERAILLAMGLCALLDPKLNPVEIVLPYVEKFVLKDKTFADVIGALVKEIGLSYLQLPHELQKTLRRLNEGTVSLRLNDLSAHGRQLYLLGHQFLYAFLGVSGLFLSGRWREAGLETESHYALTGAILFGITLLVSVIRNRI
jgi:predicted unusual protein kinase regulating ubiquinone biosynthesis (AarF/ABC1/UbiB family)